MRSLHVDFAELSLQINLLGDKEEDKSEIEDDGDSDVYHIDEGDSDSEDDFDVGSLSKGVLKYLDLQTSRSFCCVVPRPTDEDRKHPCHWGVQCADLEKRNIFLFRVGWPRVAPFLGSVGQPHVTFSWPGSSRTALRTIQCRSVIPRDGFED